MNSQIHVFFVTIELTHCHTTEYATNEESGVLVKEQSNKCRMSSAVDHRIDALPHSGTCHQRNKCRMSSAEYSVKLSIALHNRGIVFSAEGYARRILNLKGN